MARIMRRGLVGILMMIVFRMFMRFDSVRAWLVRRVETSRSKAPLVQSCIRVQFHQLARHPGYPSTLFSSARWFPVTSLHHAWDVVSARMHHDKTEMHPDAMQKAGMTASQVLIIWPDQCANEGCLAIHAKIVIDLSKSASAFC